MIKAGQALPIRSQAKCSHLGVVPMRLHHGFGSGNRRAADLRSATTLLTFPFLGMHPTTIPSTQPRSPFHVSASSSLQSSTGTVAHTNPTCSCSGAHSLTPSLTGSQFASPPKPRTTFRVVYPLSPPAGPGEKTAPTGHGRGSRVFHCPRRPGHPAQLTGEGYISMPPRRGLFFSPTRLSAVLEIRAAVLLARLPLSSVPS